jgi:glycosyltransferase involved in cell wall biosynthesis
MRQVWTEIPEAILLMAGPSAHRDKPTRQAIEGLRPEERDRLRLVDDFPDSESASIFSACDLLALPSVEESFGLVFLEAWLCGRPVIGARIPSTECVIDVGRDGMIVNPMDPASLAEAVLQLLRHPEQRKAMGEEGRRKVLARYTRDRMTDRWEALLESVARGRTAVAPGYADPLVVPAT